MGYATVEIDERDCLVAFGDADLVALASEALRRSVLGAESPDLRRGSTLTPADRPDRVMLQDERVGGVCVMPRTVLRSLAVAALTALAARELLAARVATATIIGSGAPVAGVLTALVNHVVNLGEVALWPGEGEQGWPTPKLAAHAAERGLMLSRPVELDRALLGTDLVVLAPGVEAVHRQVDLGMLARGAVVVNASGEAPTEELTRAVGHVITDVPRPVAVAEPVRAGRASRPAPGPVALGELLRRPRAGWEFAGESVLVDLQGVPGLEVALASRLYEIALVRGLGVVRHGLLGSERGQLCAPK
ncbi:hypothetical protein [Streptomyces sp. NRRL WC-3742]|uniref:hypothetical protein n=1 Tax=Streptomyces sp. NRRL WC-3742 TaxID=1463934 RepID=UPI0004CB31F4|nr:hypothetical protein [Streptomyces sp. NRRL WC-3742]